MRCARSTNASQMHGHASLQVSTPELLVTLNVHSCDHGVGKVLSLKNIVIIV